MLMKTATWLKVKSMKIKATRKESGSQIKSTQNHQVIHIPKRSKSPKKMKK